ncbi:MAG: 2-amino-4-hydroxy-6-hydroxymethyldihydropteridine diphosphokinase [Candidatus Omnitrophica bacterium]|nr:2-amino-4-hydroxy-6-hydroxymethyldihydropteridine diphosphokinase [Candidatus Omnitrophota bacterium]MDD5661299.1 2-amino-4-hydroxy-6-hydroxymethyldihydropteridine diphosphokinase [Candidatus Omnitrophota bacterium]
MATCYLGIGSNLGNRRKNIKLAVKKVGALKDTCIIKESSVFETLPVGGPAGQPNYFNSVLKIQTKVPPLILLKKLKRIEKELGRGPSLRFGPRTIDLDILLYADKVIKNKKLTIPHPRMFLRDFVIKPLKEVL